MFPKTNIADSIPQCPPVEISANMAAGLRECKWPGRNQILHSGHITYYFDGAHTENSMEACVRWFNTAYLNQVNNQQR